MRVRKGREMKTKSRFQEQAPSVVYACELHAIPPNFYMKGGGGVVSNEGKATDRRMGDR
jgi:hypothetical protein